jgi:hypothetical protein
MKKILKNDTVLNLNVKLLSEPVQKELQIKKLVLNLVLVLVSFFAGETNSDY